MDRIQSLEIELKEMSVIYDIVSSDNRDLSKELIETRIHLAVIEEENKRLKAMKFYRHPVSIAMLTFSSCMIINNLFSWIVYYYIKAYT